MKNLFVVFPRKLLGEKLQHDDEDVCVRKISDAT